MTTSKIQMDQIRSTSATVTGENIRAGSQKKSSLSPAEGLQGASPDATCTCPSGDGSLRHPCPAHPAPVERVGTNVGHGHVFPRADGVKMRCGGPGLCSECAADASRARAALAQPSPAQAECIDCHGSGFCMSISNEEIRCPCGAPIKFSGPAQAEQAEAERPVVIARLYRSNDLTMTPFAEVQKPLPMPRSDGTLTVEPLMTVAQHERIVEALLRQKHEADTALAWATRHYQALEQERDAALARVADLTATRNRYGVDAHYFNKNLQRILRDFESFTPDELARSLIILAKVADEKVVAQHSVPEASEQEKEQGWNIDYRFVERVTDLAASRTEYTTNIEATEQVLLAARELLAAAPGKEGL
ncbi:hypothetical protein [Pseudomonas phage vB_Pae_BR141b]|nr:hypothetical protein [Pseudomonas phage vB_Pae_BR141b]